MVRTIARAYCFPSLFLYSLLRTNSGGGGLLIGALKDLQPNWVGQGDDQAEYIVIEVWFEGFPVRILNGYGPQECDDVERKKKFWESVDREVKNAVNAGAGMIIQMDSNSHLGPNLIKDDVNPQNKNGKMCEEFLERNPHLELVNAKDICEGNITRIRKTSKGVERSILDIFIVCDKVAPFVTKMMIDEKRSKVLSNFSAIRKIGRIVESDHNVLSLHLSLSFSPVKSNREEIFQLHDSDAQNVFKRLTSETEEFTKCFKTTDDFKDQASRWHKVFKKSLKKSFKRVRVTDRKNKKNVVVDQLMEKRRQYLMKTYLEDVEEKELANIEDEIANECENANKQKVVDNLNSLASENGDVNYQGIWQIKKKIFPKVKPTKQTGKRNVMNQLITNPSELKELYLSSFIYRLRHRPTQPGFEDVLDTQNEVFKMRLELSKRTKSPDWSLNDLEKAIKSLKSGKCRDPEGLIKEIFKEKCLGENLKESLLILFNKIKETRIIPDFMQTTNICAIYKGKGDVTDLESDRGIFLVTILRTLLMKLVYNDIYPIVEKSMSDSNIGARKEKNIRNHIFVLNSVIFDVLKGKSRNPVDIMVLDYKQMFDSECLFEVMNDLYEAGVVDDKFALIFEANRINKVAVKTPHGLSRRMDFEEIVMQGDVLAPLLSSLQVDTFGKECFVENKHLYMFKDTVPIGPLGMVDDLLTISSCGYKTNLLNQFLNCKTGCKRLQFGCDKCVKMHIGKTNSDILCKDVSVGKWQIDLVKSSDTGKVSKSESFVGEIKMKLKQDQKYLGDVISADGSHAKNIRQRCNKGLGIINEIMSILGSTYFGKYFFETALILRESLFLSSLLLNSEAWVGYTEKDVRALEKCDEMLLSKILGCDKSTSNTFKYLELGIIPIRFVIMQRKLGFLQYLLKQEKDSMVFQVLQATIDDPRKNDFVFTCKKYLKTLKLEISFEEIENLSKGKFKNLLKQKVRKAAFLYLNEIKETQKKIKVIKYKTLKIQDYFCERNIEVCRTIFNARGRNLDIKIHKKWKFDDLLCVGCNKIEESEDEILMCEGLGNAKNDSYDMFFSQNIQDQIEVGKELVKRLKNRKQIMENQLM